MPCFDQHNYINFFIIYISIISIYYYYTIGRKRKYLIEEFYRYINIIIANVKSYKNHLVIFCIINDLNTI